MLRVRSISLFMQQKGVEMKQRAVSVPCAGDKAYTRALKTVASEKGLRIADIVRKAIDGSEYATDVNAALLRMGVSFFESSAASTQQSDVNAANYN